MNLGFSRSWITLIALFGILLISIVEAPSPSGAVSSTQYPIGSGSWNPRVSCSSPWIVRITDITDNMTGSASLSNSIFNPGITSPVGTAKRWLTSGATPPGWVSPGPPCTITNSHGQVSMFVEIDGVKRGSISNEDCTGTYDPVNGGASNGGNYCDTTFNIYDPAVVPTYSSSCSNSSDKTCYGRIHIEIDHDWKAAKYCGASTACDDVAINSQTTSSSVLDVQGFVYWDPGNLNQQWHSFSGWEIHPVTGWRFHQSTPPSPDFSISASPASISVPPGSSGTSSISLASIGGFTGTVSLSSTVSPSGPTVSLNPASITLSSGSTATSTLTVQTQSSTPIGTYTVTVKGSSGSLSHSTTVSVSVGVSPDFSISANPSSLTVSQSSSTTSTITLTSMNGFSGAVSLSTSISPSGPKTSLSSSTLTLTPGGSATSTLNIRALHKTNLGTYTITVTATSGSISHSTTINLTVTA